MNEDQNSPKKPSLVLKVVVVVAIFVVFFIVAVPYGEKLAHLILGS
jgi:hypothetical protein